MASRRPQERRFLSRKPFSKTSWIYWYEPIDLVTHTLSAWFLIEKRILKSRSREARRLSRTLGHAGLLFRPAMGLHVQRQKILLSAGHRRIPSCACWKSVIQDPAIQRRSSGAARIHEHTDMEPSGCGWIVDPNDGSRGAADLLPQR